MGNIKLMDNQDTELKKIVSRYKLPKWRKYYQGVVHIEINGELVGVVSNHPTDDGLTLKVKEGDVVEIKKFACDITKFQATPEWVKTDPNPFPGST